MGKAAGTVPASIVPVPVMNWQTIKQGLTVYSNIKFGLIVVGILTAITFPKTFQERPTTLVIATVSRTVIHDDMIKMNLSIIIKCLTSQSRQCSHQLWKIQWPSVGESEVKMPNHLQEGTRGPFDLPNGDLQGRKYHELELLSALRGTDTIVINAEINGRVVREDIRLLDIKGINILEQKYECRSGHSFADRKIISQVICEETISLKDRLVALIPLMGN